MTRRKQAYRRSLEIKTQLGEPSWASDVVWDQLGNLYKSSKLNRPEEACPFTDRRRILMLSGRFEERRHGPQQHCHALCKLQRYDEARREIQRAIECNKPFGHAAEPWKTFNILHQIETATGNSAAARAAWQQARDAYLAYRQQGGYAQAYGGKLVDQVLGLLAQQQVDDMQALCNELGQIADKPDTTDSQKLLIQALVAALNGSRNPALADDPALYYRDAAEVLFLIERL
jgi:hypothetical protein